jgi:glycerol-3-phosphate dehydrogenase (NAD(P)+)
MENERINIRLPGVKLPEELKISGDYACVTGCKLVVVAAPSFPIRSVSRGVAPYIDEDAVVVSVTKGIEDGSLLRMSQVVHQETGREVVVLTGPSHAEEVAQEIPTGCLAACENRVLAEFVQDAFMSDTFRIYTSPDPVGAELGAALKNVIALCAGVTDGLGMGDNTKALLMTRGLTEIARLGVALGAQKETFAGLAGIGDLIVTCTSMHSRNRRAGILIGQGRSPKEAMEEVGAVVEGYYAAKSAWELAKSLNVEMPILQAAYMVLYEGASASKVVSELLLRSRRAESEDAGWL